MPRDVKIRDGAYQSDVAYLSRLGRAIQKDPSMAEKQKKEAGKQIHSLIVLLVNVTYGKGAA